MLPRVFFIDLALVNTSVYSDMNISVRFNFKMSEYVCGVVIKMAAATPWNIIDEHPQVLPFSYSKFKKNCMCVEGG